MGAVTGRPPASGCSEPGRWPHLNWHFYAPTGGHPDLQRGGEHRADAATSRRVPTSRRACSWSTTAAPTAPLSWSRRRGAGIATCTCCDGTRSPGWGVRTGPVSAGGLERGYDAFIEMDCDFSHDPGGVARTGGADQRGLRGRHRLSLRVEGGSIPNWAWHRELLSRGGNLYAAAVLGLGVQDSTAGFRLLHGVDPAAAEPRSGSAPRAMDSRSR